MERYFEKISFEQFKKDFDLSYNDYCNYDLPKRATKYSAGYDFFAIVDTLLPAGKIIKIPTGYKVKMLKDEMLMLVDRSSLGFKHNIRLTNQVGIIESDFYNNETNEGHMWISLQNESEKDYTIKKGEGYVQGIFVKFLTAGDNPIEKRVGGFGSTNERNNKNE